MSHLQHEEKYRQLVARFLAHDCALEEFVHLYFAQWRADRDAQFASIDAGMQVSYQESELCAVLDQIFTACDCYEPKPLEKYQIGGEQLLAEVRELGLMRWPGVGV